MLKRILFFILSLLLLLGGCTQGSSPQVLATTRPVYDFTAFLCQNTGITTQLLITENVSCLHDYSLQVSQMKMLEKAELIVLNGAGLEDFLADALPDAVKRVDSSAGIGLLCPDESHEHGHHEGHSHEVDPHIWLSIENAKIMAQNICDGLCAAYPQHEATFLLNLASLCNELNSIAIYARQELSGLGCKEMITFHDGFAYLAESLDLTILKALEEEAGAEASAAELIQLIAIVNEHSLPAIFTEVNGSTSAAQIIAAETGAKIYALDMGMSKRDYFEMMHYNIDTIKEALQ